MGHIGSLAADLEKCPFCGNKKGLILRLNKRREWAIACPGCLTVMVEPLGLPPKLIKDQLITFEYFHAHAADIMRSDFIGHPERALLTGPDIDPPGEQFEKLIEAAKNRLIKKWNNRYTEDKNGSK